MVTQALDKDEFTAFFKSISTRKEIVNLMKQYSTNGAHMTVEDFQSFLVSEQGMPDASNEYCLEMILSHEPTETGKKMREMGIDGLTNYLKSQDGDIFNPAHDEVYQDMSHPLTHYYVASSHNTYLLQDQLRGPSSVDAYINALKKGCRCVELDCWDGDNGEPIVYPVILSLENHCTLPNQKKIAELLEEILGDTLYKVSVDSEFTTFPSPEFFKNRILIKGKKLKAEQETDDDDEGDVTDEDEAADIDHEAAAAALEKTGEGAEGAASTSATPPVKRKKPKKEPLRRSFRAVGKVVRSAGKFKEETNEEKGGKKKKKQQLAKELSRCVNYVSSVGFKALNTQNKIVSGIYSYSSIRAVFN
ncbi:hypothetical protein OS493_023230 [Desmophyllum pertusum]|uniref:Phosphoinositide phospholipase C n=1 Tax=Desmophyllum pertusum TaxID=174260 RepID=A0A9W9YMC5_9CNID|nr:hypothetical protein OS493_023230 [Desmophyllum pertusum]